MSHQDIIRSQPANCRECEKWFMKDTVAQARAKHTAALFGTQAAESEFNEAYEARHEDHRQAAVKIHDEFWGEG